MEDYTVGGKLVLGIKDWSTGSLQINNYKGTVISKNITEGNYTFSVDDIGITINSDNKIINSIIPIIDTPWNELFRSIKNGSYKEKYKVGDVIQLFDNFDISDIPVEIGNIYMQIAGFDVDILSKDNNKTAAVTFISSTQLNQRHKMNDSATAIGGYNASELKTYLEESIFTKLPQDIQNNIESVRKVSYVNKPTEQESWAHQYTDCLLWVLANGEVTGSTIYENTHKYPIFEDMSSRIRTFRGNPANYWLRTSVSATNFQFIKNNGDIANFSANAGDIGIVLGFCVGISK